MGLFSNFRVKQMFETKQFDVFLPTASEGKESKAVLKSHCQLRGKNMCESE